MSREIAMQIQPGESVEDFTTRIADTAPVAPSEVIDRLRALLAIDARRVPVQRAALPQTSRTAA